jgi:ABC-2 type transport system permease protein
MKKYWASVQKEIVLFLNDKVGVLLMYMMPILLVFIITIVQNSAFQLVSENRLDLLVVNKDTGAQGDSLISMLKMSGSFSVEEANSLHINQLKSETIDRKKLIAIWIPPHFTAEMDAQAGQMSNNMLSEFGAVEKDSTLIQPNHTPLQVFYDPVLQENFRLTLMSSLSTLLEGLQNKNRLNRLFKDMGYDEIPAEIQQSMQNSRQLIVSEPATSGEASPIPNSTQHNVPAWSIFAMFFMVISLGGNLVKERLTGSFVRLRTIPGSFPLVLLSKMTVYLFISLSQLMILFALGKFVFPFLGLPELNFPQNVLALIVISVLSALAAISYAILIGTFAKTQEQSNGFGAISIIIFAAIGGIWVPSFIMPEYLQFIGLLSPLHWCIEGFYILFLKGGSWSALSGTIIYLLLFTFACQLLTVMKMRSQNYL